MKKTLIISTLVLAIATSIVAGTLAIYNKTLDFGGNVTAKTFDIRETQNETLDIKLAPSESDSWNFTLTNTDNNGNATEVDMETSVVVSLPAEFADVSVELFVVNADGSKTSAGAGVVNGSTTTFANPSFSEAGVATSVDYEMVFTWNNVEENTEAHTALGLESVTKAVSVTVTGTQVVA